jgi:hypothetical protein
MSLFLEKVIPLKKKIISFALKFLFRGFQPLLQPSLARTLVFPTFFFNTNRFFLQKYKRCKNRGFQTSLS